MKYNLQDTFTSTYTREEAGKFFSYRLRIDSAHGWQPNLIFLAIAGFLVYLSWPIYGLVGQSDWLGIALTLALACSTLAISYPLFKLVVVVYVWKTHTLPSWVKGSITKLDLDLRSTTPPKT